MWREGKRPAASPVLDDGDEQRPCAGDTGTFVRHVSVSVCARLVCRGCASTVLAIVPVPRHACVYGSANARTRVLQRIHAAAAYYIRMCVCTRTSASLCRT